MRKIVNISWPSSSMNVYWPEVTKFCGCCSLNTGIYIVGTFYEILTLLIFIREKNEFKSISEKRAQLPYVDIPIESAKRSLLLETFGEDNNLTVPYLDQMLHEYSYVKIAWMIFHLLFLISTPILFYGIYKEKAFLLRLFLNICVPMWVFRTIFNIFECFTASIPQKFLVICSALLVGYQILAVRSAYRIMTGQSKFYKETDEISISNNSSNSNDHIVSRRNTLESNPPQYEEFNRHCETCQCANSQTRVLEAIPNSAINFHAKLNNLKEKQINFEEETVIYDENQLNPGKSPLVEDPLDTINQRTAKAIRPNSLNLGNSSKKDKQEDIHVIYDPHQLNIGRSPIIEDKK